MKFIPAFAALGLFSWLGYMVMMGTFPDSDGGSSKTRMVKDLVHMSIEKFGQGPTTIGLFATGAILAFFFVTRGLDEEQV